MSAIDLLFPTPVLRADINRGFTDKEKETLDIIANNLQNNHNNLISKESYLFDYYHGLKDIYKFCLNTINEYIEKIYDPVDKIEPYITQSWLNITTEGQSHHEHDHINSFLSGVFYINADPKVDSIRFHKKIYQQIHLVSKNYNRNNSSQWYLPVGTGTCIVFPSGLTHSVDEIKYGDHPRASIAFNSFIKGTIGTSNSRTELKLS